MLSNNYLQIRGIKKTDEGTYRCEGRILARGEINFKDIQVIVNGEQLRVRLVPGAGYVAPALQAADGNVTLDSHSRSTISLLIFLCCVK